MHLSPGVPSQAFPDQEKGSMQHLVRSSEPSSGRPCVSLPRGRVDASEPQ